MSGCTANRSSSLKAVKHRLHDSNTAGKYIEYYIVLQVGNHTYQSAWLRYSHIRAYFKREFFWWNRKLWWKFPGKIRPSNLFGLSGGVMLDNQQKRKRQLNAVFADINYTSVGIKLGIFGTTKASNVDCYCGKCQNDRARVCPQCHGCGRTSYTPFPKIIYWYDGREKERIPQDTVYQNCSRCAGKGTLW